MLRTTFLILVRITFLNQLGCLAKIKLSGLEDDFIIKTPVPTEDDFEEFSSQSRLKRTVLTPYLEQQNVRLFTEFTILPRKLAPRESCAVVIPERSSYLHNHWVDVFIPGRISQTKIACITFNDVNEAYILARRRIKGDFPNPDTEWTEEQIETSARVTLEVTYILAEKFHLERCEVSPYLSKIDTTSSLLGEICPGSNNPMICYPGRFRRFDGLCNNIRYPSWGASKTTFSRMQLPDYADGLSSPRGGQHHTGLPSPRLVSSTIHTRKSYLDAGITTFFVLWGQFMDHDISTQVSPPEPEDKCCDQPRGKKGHFCFEIDIPKDDPFYSQFNNTCHEFLRALPSQAQNCKLGFSKQMNRFTSVIDGEMVYGTNEKDFKTLRSFHGGELKMVPYHQEPSLEPHLLFKTEEPDEGCIRSNKDSYCFLAGDPRVNEQMPLASIHTLLSRHHNKIVKALSYVNPHWDDNRLYFEGRHIMAAMLQRITYNEFLPLVLGDVLIKDFYLKLLDKGYWDGYNPSVNPSTLAEFAGAAYRFGHTLLPNNIELWSLDRHYIKSIPLRDMLLQPFLLAVPYQTDLVIMGMLNQLAEACDAGITKEVLQFLFKMKNKKFGGDLASLNIQRGRDFGLRPFMSYREYCGFHICSTWEDCYSVGLFDNHTLNKFMEIYDSPLDIDLFSGGLSERPLPNALLGPTFGCIVAMQFHLYRHGDRFWHELPNQPSSFSPDQLQEIRRTKLSHIICANTDRITEVQTWPFILFDPENNPFIPCKTPEVHFNALPWKEPNIY